MPDGRVRCIGIRLSVFVNRFSFSCSAIYICDVIKSWANRSTQRFAEEGRGRFSGLDETLARRRLRLLDEAERLEDLTGLSSVGLHRL
jgi:hypothetical protein